MNLSIALAGLPVTWRLNGATELSGWLSSRPWLSEGGVRALKVPPAALELVRTAINREVHAYHQGRGRVQVVELPQEDVALGPSVAFARELGLSETLFEREMANILGEQVTGEAMVCLAPAFALSSPVTLIEQFIRFVEMIGKLGHNRSPVILVLHDSQDVSGPGSLRLDRGHPLGASELVVDRGVPETRAWLYYVHVRLAWDTGGDLDMALTLDESRMGGLRLGDEDGLEHILNDHAVRVSKKMGPQVLDGWRKYFEGIQVTYQTGKTKVGQPVRPDGVPLEAGLAPPWVARALASSQPASALQPLLRSLLICRPLAEQILSRTFALEALIRCQLPTPPAENAPPEALKKCLRFETEPDFLYRRLYPAAHPYQPIDPWDFASLGEVTTALSGMEMRVTRAVHRMRILRNAIAHHHYSGWAAVRELREVEASLVANAGG